MLKLTHLVHTLYQLLRTSLNPNFAIFLNLALPSIPATGPQLHSCCCILSCQWNADLPTNILCPIIKKAMFRYQDPKIPHLMILTVLVSNNTMVICIQHLIGL